jgi:hypothetical protein
MRCVTIDETIRQLYFKSIRLDRLQLWSLGITQNNEKQ